MGPIFQQISILWPIVYLRYETYTNRYNEQDNVEPDDFYLKKKNTWGWYKTHVRVLRFIYKNNWLALLYPFLVELTEWSSSHNHMEALPSLICFFFHLYFIVFDKALPPLPIQKKMALIRTTANTLRVSLPFIGLWYNCT